VGSTLGVFGLALAVSGLIGMAIHDDVATPEELKRLQRLCARHRAAETRRARGEHDGYVVDLGQFDPATCPP